MHKTLVWLPRVAGAAVGGFLAVFALDSQGGPMDALLHLVPALVAFTLVATAWRRPLVGAIGFAACAALYGISTRRLDWFAVIGVPLLVVSGLHVLSWRRQAADPGR